MQPWVSANMDSPEPDLGAIPLNEGTIPSPQAQPDVVAVAFTSLIGSMGPKRTISAISKFVKKLDFIPEISLPPTLPCKVAISLAEKGLVGQFTSLWSSPKTIQKWVERNWAQFTQGKISIYLCGRGHYTFHVESNDDRDLIFRSGRCFMDTRGLYLKI